MSKHDWPVCWDRTEVPKTVVVDAVMPSDAVFLATHQPTQLLRRKFGQRGGGEVVSEEDFLTDFLKAENNGLLLTPIVGGSGSGKSHLVRWLKLRIRAQHAGVPEAEWPQRVVYIPKYGTNLRKVILEILKGMEGTEFEKIRNSLAEAQDSLSEDRAAYQLLDALSYRVGPGSQLEEPSPAADRAQVKAVKLRNHLRKEFPKLLGDSIFKDRLLAKDGVIRRLVRECLEGKKRADDDKDSPFQFVVDDLPTDVAQIEQAGKAAIKLFQLLAGNKQLREMAVAMLNDELNAAISEVFGMRGESLLDVMLALRESLLASKKELILLIEDFTVLQGIQHDLLDAILEAPVRDGKQVLCNIRTAMAVTSGYFENLDTAMTRVNFGGYEYSLDLPYDDATAAGAVTPAAVHQFVAGYLNAARMGKGALDQAFGNWDESSGEDWVPNACLSCARAEDCHQAFGASAGYGLYPFNTAALDRIVRSICSTQFDPRLIMSEVLYHTLWLHFPDLESRLHPTKRYAEKYITADYGWLDQDLQEDLKKPPHDARLADRRVALLTFWGGNPDQLSNLPAGVHEAFSLPPLVLQESVKVADDGQTTSKDQPAPVVEGEKRRAQKEPTQGKTKHPTRFKTWGRSSPELQEINTWADGKTTITQGSARNLRTWIHQAIVDRIEWNETHWRSDKRFPGHLFDAQSSIIIEGAKGGKAKNKKSGTIELRLSYKEGDTSDPLYFGGPRLVRFLRALVALNEFGAWEFDRGAEYLRLVTGTVDEMARRVLEAIQGRWNPVAAVTDLLAIGSRILNVPGAGGNQDAQLIRSLFESAPPPLATATSSSSVERSSHWRKLAAACSEGANKKCASREDLQRELMLKVGRAQGTGQVAAIDPRAVLEAIKDLKGRKWRLVHPPPEERSDLWNHFRSVQERLKPGIEGEGAVLREWLAGVQPALGEEIPEAKTLTSTLSDVFRDAITLGVFRPHRENYKAQFEEDRKALERRQLGVVKEVCQALEEEPEVPSQLRVLAPDRCDRLTAVKRFVDTANTIMERTSNETQAAIERSKEAGSDIAHWQEKVSNLLREVTDFLGEEGLGESL